MKLKDYMRTHEGEYLVAETMRTVTVEQLGDALADLDIEPHRLGADAAGRQRFHLYGTDWTVHLVTHVEPTAKSQGTSRATR